MNRSFTFRRTSLIIVRVGLAASLVAKSAVAATPTDPGNELPGLGFKVLVATTPAQKDWVKRMAPGQIRAMQRTGKKYFVYPDAPRNQIYVGGPKEYDAYKQLHPDNKLAGQEGAKQASEYRAKQDTAMQKRTARDLSDPYYGAYTATWADFGLE
jgi:hypothetical protein